MPGVDRRSVLGMLAGFVGWLFGRRTQADDRPQFRPGTIVTLREGVEYLPCGLQIIFREAWQDARGCVEYCQDFYFDGVLIATRKTFNGPLWVWHVDSLPAWVFDACRAIGPYTDWHPATPDGQLYWPRPRWIDHPQTSSASSSDPEAQEYARIWHGPQVLNPKLAEAYIIAHSSSGGCGGSSSSSSSSVGPVRRTGRTMEAIEKNGSGGIRLYEYAPNGAATISAISRFSLVSAFTDVIVVQIGDAWYIETAAVPEAN